MKIDVVYRIGHPYLSPCKGSNKEQFQKKNRTNTKTQKFKNTNTKPQPEKASQPLFRMRYIVGPPAHQSGKATLRLADSHHPLIDKFLIGISLFSIIILIASVYLLHPAFDFIYILPIAEQNRDGREYTQNLSFCTIQGKLWWLTVAGLSLDLGLHTASQIHYGMTPSVKILMSSCLTLVVAIINQAKGSTDHVLCLIVT